MTLDSEDRAFLRDVLLFRAVSDDLLPDLADEIEARDVTRGTTIFEQGAPVSHFFVVRTGWTRLYRLMPDGTEVVVEVFGPGESFAEGAPFMADGYPVTAEMVEDGRLLAIPVEAWIGRLTDRPELAVRLLSACAVQLQRLVSRIETLHSRSAPQRLAEFLLRFSSPAAGGGRSTVPLPYDKHLIAGRLGIRPETLSRAFLRLRAHGVTVTGRTVHIDDHDALRRYIAS